MADPDMEPGRSRWAVSPLEAVVFAVLGVFAVLSALMNASFFVTFTPGEAIEPTPVWPVIVLFGAAAFLIRHRRARPKADAYAEPSEPVDPFWDQ